MRSIDPPSRRWSLRREWSRAFTIMLALLFVASVGTLFGVRHLVGQISGTAHQFDRETTVVASLRISMVDHEQVAHQLLSGHTVDRAAFVAKQNEISRQFASAARVFPASGPTRGILHKTEISWLTGLSDAGLEGAQVALMHGAHLTENPVFGAASDDSRGMLDDLQQPALEALRHHLASDADLERVLIGSLAGLFLLALSVTWYFRRRMARDLLGPVARMHAGVVELHAGGFEHRIEVARHDELGDLAEAFNEMASALHESHQALTIRATHDMLTGLPNRASLAERLGGSFGGGAERRSRPESVLFIDIDDFKNVNDSLGHEAGDALLIQLAERLTGCVRPHDLVARLGGDEFAVVVVDGEDEETAVAVADRILAALSAPFVVNGTRLAIAASIGIAPRRVDTANAAELLRQADFAMYMAKGAGKGRYQVFDAQMHGSMGARTALQSDLALAAPSGQLRLEYQPVVELSTGRIFGLEALVRWAHPTLGMLSPAEFIPLAEETGDIDAIGCWVLDTATRQVAGWRSTVPDCERLLVSVNLSAFQLATSSSRASVRAILADPVVQADKVVLEITETALAADVEGGIAALAELKGYGARIAIDDFGIGFSSLSTLASLPADVLKIDRSFVSGPAAEGPSAALLEGILGLAEKLALDVVAEGIEEPEQLDLLRTLGCEFGQGYLLARPAGASDVEAMLRAGARLKLPVPV